LEDHLHLAAQRPKFTLWQMSDFLAQERDASGRWFVEASHTSGKR
jgi:hypothetical protein